MAPQQVLDLVGLEQSRQPEVVLLLRAPGLRGHAELAAVEDDPVEVGLAGQRREPAALRPVLLGQLPLGLGQQGCPRGRRRPFRPARAARGPARAPSRRRAAAGAARWARTPTPSRPRLRARTKRPTAWAKNSGVEVEVAYTPTESRGTSTPSDTIRTATIQRSSESAKAWIRLLEPGSSDSTSTGLVPLISASSSAYARATVWSVAITSPPASGTCARTSRQPGVGGLEDGRHPGAVRVERGPQRLAGEVACHRPAEPGADLVAGAGAPVQVAGVGHEQHRPDDAVGQRRRVAVRVVGPRPQPAACPPIRLVADERDRVGVGAERRAGQHQPPGRPARTPPARPRPS